MIKSSKMRLERRVVCMGRKKSVQGFHGECACFPSMHINGRIILKWTLKKCGGGGWIGFIWLKIGTSDELL